MSSPRRWLLLLFAIVVIGAPFVVRGMFPPAVRAPAPPAPARPPNDVRPPDPPVPPPPTPVPSDPLSEWRAAIRYKNEKGVLGAQAVFLAREGEYREPLMNLAKEDPEPRVRSFSVAVLGRMKVPPPESFFIERLGDGQEYPRRSALEALEKLGTSACLPKVDELASSDPAPAARETAARTAKAVRSR